MSDDAAHDRAMAEAQLKEAKAAEETAAHEKKSAQSERESAQAQKGETRVKQPDDAFMI